MTIVNRTGWHDIGSYRAFVLPAEIIGPRGSERVILDASAAGPYEARGTLKDWQAGIGELASGHALPVLLISAAFAGPLLRLAEQEGGGIHIYGGSSKGKTTPSRVLGLGSWRLAGVYACVAGDGKWPGRRGGLGLGHCAYSRRIERCGSPRRRGFVLWARQWFRQGAGGARWLFAPKTWRVLVLSTGEIPTETKLSEDRGRKARAEQMVRMLDIPADRNAGFGAFDHGGPDGDAGALAKAFKYAAISAYGTAGPEFVRRIVSEEVTGDDVRGMVANFTVDNLPARSEGQIDRAAQRLGLIAAAGELTTAMGLVPWQPREAWNAAA